MDKEDSTNIKINKDDHAYLFRNRELEKYLVFKHKEIVFSQKDMMKLIRMEIEENFEKVKKEKK